MSEPPEVTSHSFIVKIWLEELASRGRRARWRGVITHVPGGERQYLQDLRGISDFVTLHLAPMGIEPGWAWHLRRGWGCWNRAIRMRLARPSRRES